ncbi:RNA polymerase II transcription factor SIII subunit A-domain-containing protein [Paraphysoderma sedebokerense]|nr:RNA polymerase II transcription factor SIII subunit A-domain-containing protein [Paraphysoderma sedebokerense]
MLIQSRHNVPSLYHLCQSALKTCLYTMRDLRNVPFYLIEDILNTLPAEILMKLEAYNDYLIEDTNDIWMRHCLSEFPDVKEQYEDGELEFDTWRDLYMDKLEEKQQNVALAAAKLRNKYKALEKKKESRKIVVTDVVIPDKKKREHFAHTSTSTSTKSVGKSLMRKSKLQARRE